jgi:hypothetical protein
MLRFYRKQGWSDKDLCEPVDPNIFLSNVQAELNAIGVKTTRRSLVVLRGLCHLLNFAIKNKPISKLGTDIAKFQRIYAYPAQTGIGKSLSLQVYSALLHSTQVKTLIVVSRVEIAIQYCEAINRLAGNLNYARCYYKVTEDNPENKLRVKDLYRTRSVNCLVVTHSLFTKLQSEGGHQIDGLRIYGVDNPQLRQNIVIDESINLFKDYRLTPLEIKNLNAFIEHACNCFPALQDRDDFKNTKATFIALETILKNKFQELSQNKRIIDQIDAFDIHEAFIEENLQPADALIGIQGLKEFIEQALKEVEQVIKLIPKFSLTFNKYLSSNVDELQKTLENILLNNEYLLDQEGETESNGITVTLDSDGNEVVIDRFTKFMVYQPNRKSDHCIFNVIGLPTMFKSAVVLDATAEINAFYKYATKAYANPIVKVDVPQVRVYQNLNINIAKGDDFKQSRSNFYLGKSNSFKEKLALFYLQHAYKELVKGDEMLLICHKPMREVFEEHNVNQNITFTHWGDHIGRNDWSHCNKVFVAGWNSINDYAYLTSIFNAGNTDLDLTHLSLIAKRQIVYEFRHTQVADDLVQAVMRSQARVIDTIDNDCKPATIYLFCTEGFSDNEIINIFLTQFAKVNVDHQWIPKGPALPVQKTKTMKKSEEIVGYISKQLTASGQSVNRKKVEKELGYSSTTFSSYTKRDYLKDLLAANNIVLEKIDSKSYVFRKL